MGMSCHFSARRDGLDDTSPPCMESTGKKHRYRRGICVIPPDTTSQLQVIIVVE